MEILLKIEDKLNLAIDKNTEYSYNYNNQKRFVSLLIKYRLT
jgi:hypothetical protein